MNQQTVYKNRLRNLFFSSVKNDLEKWIKFNYCDFKSPIYNGIIFKTDINLPTIDYLVIDCGGTSERICAYRFFFIPIDFKVWLHVRKIKKYFKNIEKNKKDSNKIKVLKFGVENLEEVFIKEIRKEKLDKINESN